nr:hypothetical protein CFP56_74668 [Quercus suber]
MTFLDDKTRKRQGLTCASDHFSSPRTFPKSPQNPSTTHRCVQQQILVTAHDGFAVVRHPQQRARDLLFYARHLGEPYTKPLTSPLPGSWRSSSSQWQIHICEQRFATVPFLTLHISYHLPSLIMAPKKAAKAKHAAKPSSKQEESAEETKHAPKTEDEPAAEVDHEPESKTPQDEQNSDLKPSHKRKQSSAPNAPQKAARRSTRGAPKSQPSHQQLISYLLSPSAASLCRPADETAALDSDPKLRTYSATPLSPFEELLSALILSRPISHRLGLRSIRTLLNTPYNFTSARAVHDAGTETHHQALADAKTQHKAKTATQLGALADVVLAEFASTDDEDDRTGAAMHKLRALDPATQRDTLRTKISGLGPTGIEIFFRRVQGAWPATFPFVDERTARGLERLGLPADADALVRVLEESWEEVQQGEWEVGGGEKDEEAARKRRAFVVLLERVTGAELEGNSDQVLEAAANAA